MRRPRALALTTLVVGLLLTGCGLPATGHVAEIDPSSVPFGLLRTAPPGARPPQVAGPATRIYFVRNDHVVAVQRHVFGDNVPQEAIGLLLEGPTPEEAARGLTTDIPTDTRLISLDPSSGRGVFSVDLSQQFGDVSGSDQVLAVAQIVFTLTASPYINAVRFKINGKLIEAPDGSGTQAFTPRRPRDYRALVPGH